MKSKRMVLMLVLGLVLVVLLGPHSVTAQAIQSEYTATEFPTGQTYPGDWVSLPNGAQHFRGQVNTAFEQASDPLVSGNSTLVVNGNLDPTYTGPIWGTIDIEVPDNASCQGGGVWQGTWAGKMSMSQGYVYWFGVMKGVSGCVEGMMVRFESGLCEPQMPCAYSGTLLDPHGE